MSCAPKEIAIALFGHPVRAGKMCVIHAAGAVGMDSGINIEQDLYDLLPCRPIRLGVEQTQVQFQMSPVIGRQTCTTWRLIVVSVSSHPHPPSIAACATVVNLIDEAFFGK